VVVDLASGFAVAGGVFGLAAIDLEKGLVFAGIVVLLLISNALHEAGHAVVAWWMGDRRPEIRNRMTLNPLNHVHWLLTIVLPIVSYYFLHWPFGGARPVMVDAGKIGPRRMALVALAGPLGNAVFAVICAIVTASLMAFDVISDVDWAHSRLWTVLSLSIWFSVTLVVLNLVPLPPADGSRILAMFLPERVRAVYYALAPVTVVLLIVGVMWVSGFLYEHWPALGRGYPRLFEKAETWIKFQILDLVDIIRRLLGR
jgi:Zn-dependent protease